MQQNKWPIIDSIAASLGVSKNNRRLWRQRNIPFRYRLPILNEAKKKRLPITESDLAKKYVGTP